METCCCSSTVIRSRLRIWSSGTRELTLWAGSMAGARTNTCGAPGFSKTRRQAHPGPAARSTSGRWARRLARNLVTRSQVFEDFDAIEQRAQPGLYPGAGPRRLFEAEWDALETHPELEVLWMAAAGHNASVRKADFERAGGFDERLSINEHRELALRLQRAGVRVRPVPGARRSISPTGRAGATRSRSPTGNGASTTPTRSRRSS